MAWSRTITSDSIRRAITATAALLMVTMGALAAFAAPAITVKDGVSRVANGAQPSGKREVVTLQEAWRVGGDEGEDFFGLITQVRTSTAVPPARSRPARPIPRRAASCSCSTATPTAPTWW
ncbi:MAG: hypothetical protein IPH86_18950 [bacterium]|nr:hypothetical protein [bacterium]